MYLWLKSFHIIAMVCWFAALFYLPRLFVYHVDTPDKASRERFKTMECRLYWGIMVPSMAATLIFGLWMLFLVPGYLQQGWMHIKLTLVVLLVGYHHMCGAYVKRFLRDANTHSAKFYRYFNEIPVLFLFGIVIMVVVRPY